MIFTQDQLERFKCHAHRAMVQIEEWKNNRDVQVGRIAEAIQGGFSEGYYTAMHEVSSSPWEYAKTLANVERMNDASNEGWELVTTCGSGNDWLIWRRRKAVRELEVKNDV